MNHDEKIDRLNMMVAVRLAPSTIHGVGIFALRDLGKGRKMYLDNMPEAYHLPYASFNKLLPNVRQILLERWPQIVNGSAFMYPDARYQAYLNHADDPNYDAINDVLLKDVIEGEEITEDYKHISGWGLVYTWLKKEESALNLDQI